MFPETMTYRSEKRIELEQAWNDAQAAVKRAHAKGYRYIVLQNFGKRLLACSDTTRAKLVHCHSCWHFDNHSLETWAMNVLYACAWECRFDYATSDDIDLFLTSIGL